MAWDRWREQRIFKLRRKAMKKSYERVMIDVIELRQTDVIATSPTTDDNNEPGIMLPEDIF